MPIPVISVSTNILSEINFIVNRGWDQNGLPIFDVSSSGDLPEHVYLRTILHPSGTPLDITYVSPTGSNRSTFDTLLRESGYYTHEFTTITSGTYSHIFNLDYEHGNKYYELDYYLENQNSLGEVVYPPQYKEPGNFYLATAPKPQASYTQVESTISGDAQEQRLRLDTTFYTDISNRLLSSPAPYLVTISGDDGYLTISGSPLSGPSYNNDNYFYSALSGITLDLPFNSGTVEGMSDEAKTYDYDISFYNIDQLGVLSPSLIFNTKPFREASQEFDVGDIQSFTDYSLDRQSDYMIQIRPDTVSKKRFSLGIEDLGLIKTSYSTIGTYVSNYYTIDDPIYTFSMKVNEWIPDIPEVDPYNILQYWVELGSNEWIRISPLTRDTEHTLNGAVVPKLLLLDSLEESIISTEVQEVVFDSPVYTFRIRINIDMSFVGSDLFISPEIRKYECHVTDKNSFFRS